MMNEAARDTSELEKEANLLGQVMTPLSVRIQQTIETEEIRFYVWDGERALRPPVRQETAAPTWSLRFERSVGSLVKQVLAAGEASVIDPVNDHPILGPVAPSYLQSIILIPYLLGSEPLGVLVLINADRRRLDSERDTVDLLVTPALLALRGRREIQQVTLQNRELQQDKLHLLALLKELKAAKEEQETANRAVSQFISTMSHELRTPVSVIKGNVAVLMEKLGDLNPEQESRLTIIQRNAGDLLRLIQGILDISRLQEGRMPVYLEKFRAGELLKELHSEFADLSLKKGISFRVRGDSFDTPMLSDRMKVKEILNNLLTNAMKFTGKGKIEVEARHSVEDDRVEIVVRDTGIGIKSENLNQIFDLFYQVDNTDQREFGGTGIGLNIVKELVARLQGEIHVESEFGKGTTFRVILPREISLSDRG